MVVVEHGGHSVEAEAIEAVLLHPPAQVGEQETLHLPAGGGTEAHQDVRRTASLLWLSGGHAVLRVSEVPLAQGGAPQEGLPPQTNEQTITLHMKAVILRGGVFRKTDGSLQNHCPFTSYFTPPTVLSQGYKYYY